MITASTDWLDWAVSRSLSMFLMSETTVATLDWMFGGKEPLIPAASPRPWRPRRSLALYWSRSSLGVADREQPGRPIAFVLQGLYQAGDLLAEVGEL